jgi:hypothetical protein
MEMIHPSLTSRDEGFSADLIHRILEESSSIPAAARRVEKAFNLYVTYLKEGRGHEPDYSVLDTPPKKKRKK